MENSNNSLPTSYPTPGSRTSRPNDSCCAKFVRRLILSMVLLFLTISAAIFVVWRVLDPHDPVFRLNSFSVSNFTLHNSHLAANYTFELNVTNPNQKINLSIEQIDIIVRYRHTKLSTISMMKAIDLEKMSQPVTIAKSRTDSGVSLGERTASNMGADLSKGVVSFSAQMMVEAKYRASIWPSKHISMEIHCRDLKVKFSPSKVIGMWDASSRIRCKTSLR